MVATAIRFSSLATRTISDMTFMAEAASKPDVGSSRNKTVGCLTKAIPMDKRRRCPPERLAARVSAQEVSPIFSIISSMNCASSSLATTSYSCAAYIRVSRHVKYGHNLSN
mmetsp:Transcript_14410/g.31440  ORF Transcript_14410/g.31440 Transcript_14410/m.31440 type:complete len:111 (+) Transcript_14410:1329-1661(+)